MITLSLPLANKTFLRKQLLPAIALAMLGILLSQITIVAQGFGGLTSEKLIEIVGVSNSQLVIGRTGVDSPLLNIGLGPSVSTSAATGVKYTPKTTATLNGTLASLEGFPTCDTWFEWGYNTNYGTVVGLETDVAVIGSHSFNLLHYDANKTVHYRFVSEADGIVYGNDVTFSVVKDLSSTILWIFPIIFGVLGLIILLKVRGASLGEILLTAVLTVIGIVVLIEFISSLW